MTRPDAGRRRHVGRFLAHEVAEESGDPVGTQIELLQQRHAGGVGGARGGHHRRPA